MRRRIDPSHGQLMSMGATDALTGVQANASKGSDGICVIRDNAGNLEITRGVVSTADGWIRVHLVDSFTDDARTSRKWVDLPVFEKQAIGYCFDAIDVTNSTAALFTVTSVAGVDRPNMIIAL